MEKGKKTFILYKNHIEIIEDLTDSQAGKVLKNIFRYVNGKELDFDKDTYEYGIFRGIKSQIDHTTEEYLARCAQNKANINKRWRKNTTEYDRIHNDNDIDIENDNKNDSILHVDVVDKDISTATPTNNLNENLFLGEFKNVVITRGQYNKQLSYTKSDAQKYQVDIKDGEIEPFVNACIQELSENIATGKIENFKQDEPNKHAEILHKYRRQKLQKCNDISYIQKYGHPLNEIRNQEQELIF